MLREEAIAILRKNRPSSDPRECGRKLCEAVDMAIASLKTDEAYQLEYENRDFVEIPKGMTNGEVLQALFPKLELGEIVYNTRRYFLMGEAIDTFDFKTTDKWWNAPYQKGGE